MKFSFKCILQLLEKGSFPPRPQGSSDFYVASGPMSEWTLEFGDQKAKEISGVPSRDTKLNQQEKEKPPNTHPFLSTTIIVIIVPLLAMLVLLLRRQK